MAEYLMLMHGDVARDEDAAGWEVYLGRLGARGALRGGSVVGAGACFRKDAPPGPLSSHIVGYLKIEAADLDAARDLLAGNPTYEAGGTVEIRELPVS